MHKGLLQDHFTPRRLRDKKHVAEIRDNEQHLLSTDKLLKSVSKEATKMIEDIGGSLAPDIKVDRKGIIN